MMSCRYASKEIYLATETAVKIAYDSVFTVFFSFHVQDPISKNRKTEKSHRESEQLNRLLRE